ncbi:MAG: hypothetical protein HY727_07690 [Candidatus Rokubacteria bacterium]|nr:hypothetical protein [Candidatus Rokubacteria bacterium]
MRPAGRGGAFLPARWTLPAALLAIVLLGSTPARAGHEFPFYPSFYPQEIQIETVEPAAAAAGLTKASLHAYIGRDPFEKQAPPPSVGHLESLRSFLVVTFNPRGAAADGPSRCAAARRLHESFAPGDGHYILHPYPVTPYHADYLQHFDLAESAKREYQAPAAGRAARGQLKVGARGRLAEKLVQARSRLDPRAWDATVEEIDLDGLLPAWALGIGGWPGPPWLKEGWFHAYLLLAETLGERATKQAVDQAVQQLVTGAPESREERLTLERRLVGLLRRGCERVILGYTLRREPFSVEYSGGVENVAHDSQAGLASAIFLRTVKLKDFPWNGWLTLGIETRPVAAWNPIGGFTDAAGRLVWLAVGDPALFPEPYGGSWVPNRVRLQSPPERATSGAIAIPRAALLPEALTGALKEVGDGKSAGVKLTYRVLGSAFHDGTRTSVADIVYPYAFAFRWGAPREAGAPEHDPYLERATSLVRESLAAFRVLRVETDTLRFGDVALTYEVPVVDVYLHRGPSDAEQLASVAPPWSPLPWHVTALMEEAVRRGLGAFSAAEARRRGIPWLDPVRDSKVKARLASLVDDFEARGWVPPPLRGLVTAREARARWAALKQFYVEHRHWLVTNGPYRIHAWSPTSVVLQVFRDLSYPRGVGSFDGYAIPVRAYVAKVDVQRDRLEVSAEVERVERFGREYRIVTEPLTRKPSEQDRASAPVCRYLILGPDGTVVAAGTAPPGAAGVFTISLKGLHAGQHTIVLALALGGNHVNPHVRVIAHRVEGAR